MAYIIVGLPRSGTSLFARILSRSALMQFNDYSKVKMNNYEFNSDGYFENNLFNLLNDQLIRINYGKNNSFLFFKNKKKVVNEEFKYDIDENSLLIPDNYLKNYQKYCNNSWDTWALTRMLEGKKWYKCYSINNLDHYKGIKSAQKYFSNLINSKKNKNFFIKDPRVSLLLDSFVSTDYPKIIYLKRNPRHLKKSIRSHYGMNLFSRHFFYKNFVSNYFNYMIKYQPFNEFRALYDRLITNSIKKHKLQSLIIDYENLKSKQTQYLIEDFFNRKLDFSIIR